MARKKEVGNSPLLLVSLLFLQKWCEKARRPSQPRAPRPSDAWLVSTPSFFHLHLLSFLCFTPTCIFSSFPYSNRGFCFLGFFPTHFCLKLGGLCPEGKAALWGGEAFYSEGVKSFEKRRRGYGSRGERISGRGGGKVGGRPLMDESPSLHVEINESL